VDVDVEKVLSGGWAVYMLDWSVCNIHMLAWRRRLT
jgi:hypothetical protein